MRHVILLRAVNVGGNQLAMADLKALLERLGYTEVSTYLRSGNAVVTAARTDPRAIEAAVGAALSADLGMDLAVMVRTADELRSVIGRRPGPLREPAKTVVAFLHEPPAAERLAALDPDRHAPEELHADGREIFLYFPAGLGRAKLPLTLEKRLGVTATMRNWNTVTKLLQLAEG